MQNIVKVQLFMRLTVRIQSFNPTSSAKPTLFINFPSRIIKISCNNRSAVITLTKRNPFDPVNLKDLLVFVRQGHINKKRVRRQHIHTRAPRILFCRFRVSQKLNLPKTPGEAPLKMRASLKIKY